jgi:hypothetical protein
MKDPHLGGEIEMETRDIAELVDAALEGQTGRSDTPLGVSGKGSPND